MVKKVNEGDLKWEVPAHSGDRVIVPAGVMHEIRNTGKIELKFLGFGIALD